MANSRGFNYYFRIPAPSSALSCPYDHAVLLTSAKDPTLILCPVCGTPYSEMQLDKIEEEKNKPDITPKVSPGNTRPVLMQDNTKKRGNKKMYDGFGNELINKIQIL